MCVTMSCTGSEPVLLETPSVSPAEFSLAAHTRDELRFSYPVRTAKVELRALFDQDAAEHLARAVWPQTNGLRNTATGGS